MPDQGSSLRLHPERMLPADPAERTVARRLYEEVKDLPIVSPHGHVDPGLLLKDEPFSDPTALFVSSDHYVTRLLHADGVGLDELGVGKERLSDDAARIAWRLFSERWHLYAGTPVRDWLEAELSEIFEVDVSPSRVAADRIYDQVAGRLARDDYRPRALYRRFGIKVLTTTADPCDDLSAISALWDDRAWPGRVIPAFRPDRYLEPAGPAWPSLVARLGEAADIDTGEYGGYVRALEARRRYFISHGATSADHSHLDVRTDPLEAHDAARIFRAALQSTATADEMLALRRHMLFEMARMSCDDGLVMTLHPGVYRNHHSATAGRFGPDSGHDIPVRIDFTEPLRPLLDRFGTFPGFHLVLFTVDETSWSRELAPLAGFYPSVYVGVPWWYLDAPDAIRRFRAAVTETAGYSRTSGFVDDTRAFCSIPARHDMSRRVEAGVLARLVCEHRMSEEEAADVAIGMVVRQPETVFKL